MLKTAAFILRSKYAALHIIKPTEACLAVGNGQCNDLHLETCDWTPRYVSEGYVIHWHKGIISPRVRLRGSNLVSCSGGSGEGEFHCGVSLSCPCISPVICCIVQDVKAKISKQGRIAIMTSSFRPYHLWKLGVINSSIVWICQNCNCQLIGRCWAAVYPPTWKWHCAISSDGWPSWEGWHLLLEVKWDLDGYLDTEVLE